MVGGQTWLKVGCGLARSRSKSVFFFLELLLAGEHEDSLLVSEVFLVLPFEDLGLSELLLRLLFLFL